MMSISRHCISNHPAQGLSTGHQKIIHAYQFLQEFQEDQDPTQNTKITSIFKQIKTTLCLFTTRDFKDDIELSPPLAFSSQRLLVNLMNLQYKQIFHVILMAVFNSVYEEYPICHYSR